MGNDKTLLVISIMRAFERRYQTAKKHEQNSISKKKKKQNIIKTFIFGYFHIIKYQNSKMHAKPPYMGKRIITRKSVLTDIKYVMH